MKQAKDIVKAFYESDIANDPNILEEFFHPQVKAIWNGVEGLTTLDFNDLSDFFTDIRKNYKDLKIEISHLLQDGNSVSIRYKYYVRPIENPDEEIGIAHFLCIWEIKDEKLHRGYQVSQPFKDKDEEDTSYDEVNL
ncbi:nuclear transport factor 2 family protein [Mesonia ostreae]|uniref:Nuclear transport factor 2 family protein n=1 Tax=Mesonia ostreae TaxID=861110 RepID=A0ABU2KJX3_9FLAO|nr:nuclear transport factor 2 family protein [Mesonia ostreae]MDT0295005.1 nuclear transport factor 2 family protein [Mesonia ostreae]